MDNLTTPSADDPNRWTPPPFQQLSTLWRSHYPKLLSFARSLAPARYAEDVVQEAATIALRRLGNGSAPPDASAQEAMLYALVRDVANERTRQRYRRSAVEVLITGPTAAMRRHVNAALRTQRHEIVRVLDRVLATLPRRIAETFVLVHDHDVGYAEIAGFLGITPAAARSNYAKACARLRQELSALGLDHTDLRGRFDQ